MDVTDRDEVPRLPEHRYEFFRNMTEERMKYHAGPRSSARPIEKEFPCFVGGIPYPGYCFSPTDYVERIFDEVYPNKCNLLIGPGPFTELDAHDFCFAFFVDKDTRDKAVEEMNGKVFNNNPLVVRVAPPRDVGNILPPYMCDWPFGSDSDSDSEEGESDAEADSGPKEIRLEGEEKDMPIDADDHDEPGGTVGVVTKLHSAADVDASDAADVEAQEKIVEPAEMGGGNEDGIERSEKSGEKQQRQI